jgi:hypothetical protein
MYATSWQKFYFDWRFQDRLQRVAHHEKLNEIVEQRLKMEKYLDCFRSFVVISQTIADYHRDVSCRACVLVSGRVAPTLEEAKSDIEKP